MKHMGDSGNGYEYGDPQDIWEDDSEIVTPVKVAPLFVFDKVTRLTVVTESGVEYERYNAFIGGVELHLQDDGRTLKIFPVSK